MDRATLASLFEATVLLSSGAAAIVAIAARRAEGAVASRAPSSRSPSRSGVVGPALLLHPLLQLVLVCTLVYVNQVLFGAFILRAHGGDTSFVARFIGGGWFAIGAHDPVVRFAANHVGDGRWLSPTLLRVQAFLELPFVLLAYLTVARMLGRSLYRTLCRPLPLALASVSFSVAFSIVELSLPNPFTHDDVLLRALAGLTVPVYLAWIARCEERWTGALDADHTAAGPSGALGLLAFLAGAGAIATLVLALYDAFFLYNLAHFPRYAPRIAVALVIAIAASFAAPRVDGVLRRALGSEQPSLAMAVCVAALRQFTLLFFVPSLALRYWGNHATAVLCGTMIVVFAGLTGTGGALRRAKAGPLRIGALALAGAGALVTGGVAAGAAFASSSLSGMPELVLARVSLSFLVVAIGSFRVLEIFVCWPLHETKAPADEA